MVYSAVFTITIASGITFKCIFLKMTNKIFSLFILLFVTISLFCSKHNDKFTLISPDNSSPRNISDRITDFSYTAANIKKQVEIRRGKPFIRPVTPVLLTESEYYDRIMSDTAYTELSGADDYTYEILLAEGFIGLPNIYYDLAHDSTRSGTGGFYISGSDSIFVLIDDATASIDFSIKQIIFHEYLHALQDQYYDLESIFTRYRNSDQEFAARFFIEGESEYMETQYSLSEQPSIYSFESYIYSNLSSINNFLSLLHDYGIPYYYNQPYYWSYWYGALFINEVVKSQSISGIDNAVFSKLLFGTRYIFHPQYFLSGKFEDIQLNTDPLLSVITSEFKIYDYDELGELLLTVLFREWVDPLGYMSIAAGLKADRIIVYGNSPLTEPLRLCWCTLWEDYNEGYEFLTNYAKLVRSKYDIPFPSLVTASQPAYFDYRGTVNIYAEIQNDRVLIMENYSLPQREALLAALRQSSVLESPLAAKQANQTPGEVYPRIEKWKYNRLLF